MARAEEAELVADFETVDGWIQPFSGKKRAERPKAVIETVDGTRILHYSGKSKQRGYRLFPPAESDIMNPDLRSRILRYGRRLQQDVRPMRFPLMALRQQTPTCIRMVGIRSEHEAIAAAAGSSGVPATVGTKAEVKGGSFFKHPAADPSAFGTKAEGKHPSADPSATVDTKAEVKGGSFFKHPAADPSASGTKAEGKHPSADPSATGTKAEVKGGSFFKHPAADPSASGTKAEVKHPSADPSATVGTKAEVNGGSFFKHPAADPSASGIKTDQVTQGSLLKRPREDLGMSTGSLLLNKPNPALDSSAESAGTTAEVKGGSFFKRPAADPSATDEVKGGSVLKRPRVDLGESNHGLGSEPCCTSSSY